MRKRKNNMQEKIKYKDRIIQSSNNLTSVEMDKKSF